MPINMDARRNSNQQRHLGNAQPLERVWFAVITHKGKEVAELMGHDPKALEARAHRYAANLNYHRAVVQIRPA